MEMKKRSSTRSFSDVIIDDAKNYVYFFIPIIVAYNVGWLIKPLVTFDDRGPWEIVWHKIHNFFGGGDARFMFTFGSLVWSASIYWLCASFFAFLDFTQWPQFLYKYKIQDGKNAPPPTKKVLKVLAIVVLNQLLSYPLSAVTHDLLWSHFTTYEIRDVPDIYKTLGFLFIAMVGHDFHFYHSHRLLHHRLVYKYLHKVHHEWTAPIAASADYAHPVEHLIHLLSIGAPLTLAGAPVCTFFLWYMWIIIQVQNDHSGYHFPIVFSPEFHDFHHQRFHTSYGWLHFWDWFYGTDAEFEKSGVIKDRDFRIHSLQSAKEIIPDVGDNKKKAE